MNNPTQFASGRALDVICLGRLAVDLYAQQIGSRLEDAASFAKYLGGSSANIAFGSARLGLRSAMLSRVGDDHMGRFLSETLAREGCDISHVAVDPQRLTALVMLGIKDKDTFPLIFFREDCADMAIDPADIDERFIASSKSLLITGTHFSTAAMHAASGKALKLARANNVRTVLDIDYRPVLWGLSGKGDGETRFVSNDGVTGHLQAILPQFDLVVGTEEEFMIAGGGADIIAALRAVRLASAATLVVKRGPLGCAVIDGAIPAALDEAFNFRGVQVEVLNVLGAGDAFLSGFLKGWLNGADYATCCRYANACGALVVSRHGCAPAMPTPVELDYFIAHAARMQRPADDAALARLHRVSVARKQWDELCVFAFDHRNQFFELAQQTGADEARLPALKQLMVRAVGETEAALQLGGKIGVLIDDRYGADALNAATGRGWWIGRPVELPGSNPLQFDWGRSIGSHLNSWPKEHVIKCLVQLHPDDAVENRLEQEAQLKALYDAAQISGHELLLEVIPSKSLPSDADTVLRAVKRLYNIGIYPEWWKLEQLSAAQWKKIDALVQERDPYCRGVVLLGLHAPIDELAASFEAARDSATCRGFLVGRTIFHEPSKRWLAKEIDDAGLVAALRANFETLIRTWQRSRAAKLERAA
ncbi:MULTISPECIES: bifunctional 5-dehydro-2-deoxygluconokinase/5-dehydro-2-deoxyphosphogluconate aldolase [unclassified Janthinobacterium]|uniref:bifunctional 5-dehydro-2-deoxygluconokinase/5-dehydro-2- deoxyphosphogluconate aldolase n=1 Tax=unclassified Janthinobacterium TaxID=2610881 RepID=UPI0003473A75|nr:MULTISPECIES: 5-dehydro-2-deoxygluconokinase [unclassified Janthinobacterium]MEC5162626.1 5-dehydro-2-deoxygluconokinase [Janthinobacterium sp. CG_S6]